MYRTLTLSLLLCITQLVTLKGQSNSPFPYQLDPLKDLIISSTSLGMFAGGMLSQNELKPVETSLLRDLRPQQVWGIDRAAVRQFSLEAVDASDIIKSAAFATPILLAVDNRVRNEWLTIGVMLLEANLLTEGVTRMVKTSALRLRPYAYNPEAPMDLKQNRSTQLSFFSGHTSMTAVNSFFAAKIFNDLHPDSKWKPVVWGLAALIPAATGTCRYLGGRHYPTDIMAGYATGALIGILIPQVHKIKIGNRTKMSVQPTAGMDGSAGFSFSLQF